MIGDDGKERCIHGTEIWPERDDCHECSRAWKALGIGNPPKQLGGEWEYPTDSASESTK